MEFDYITDKRIKWELIKYEIRKYTINYCSKKKHEDNAQYVTYHLRLNELEAGLGNNPSKDNSDEYNFCKIKLQEIEDHRAEGSIVRSKAKWIEKGEKSKHYFFSLKKANYSKKHIRNLTLENGNKLIKNKHILNEALNFYSNLYKSVTHENDNEDVFFNSNTPKLCEDKKLYCDKAITIEECLKILLTFKNNKSPGNDGITKEFYLKIWNEISEILIESYNYSYTQGSLSTSQKQAIITWLAKINYS